jgi:hypothetical protein
VNAGLHKSLEELSPAEMWERALDYSLLAATARTADAGAIFLRVAERLQQRAAKSASDGTGSHGSLQVTSSLSGTTRHGLTR